MSDRNPNAIIRASSSVIGFIVVGLLSLWALYLLAVVGGQLSALPEFEVTYEFALLAVSAFCFTLGGLLAGATGLARALGGLTEALWPPKTKASE